MGLFYNLLIGIVHLLFVAFDILFVMILIRVVYERWRPEWLRLINKAVEPVVDFTIGHVEMLVTKITDRTYTDKTLTVILILCLSVLRFVIASFLK